MTTGRARAGAPFGAEPRSLAELEEEYEILGEIGRGGSAIVYRAVDRSLGREVAIKVVVPGLLADDDAVARLAREARTVAQLHHPHIVTVYAVRRLRDGGLALVMQYVPGRTLKETIARDGALAPERAERVLRDVAGALAFAHARGIVHRDVKPENIFLEHGTGRALLADFGIARSLEHDVRLTHTGTAIGTPSYMSPEQIDGAALDGRSDLYSLGVVAWEMLTGRRAWDGEGLYNVIYKQKHEELPPIEALRAGVPARLQYIIERMLQKNPSARWAGVDGMLAQLSHNVLPQDYPRWQSAHQRRVERWRAIEQLRSKPAALVTDAASTVRFDRSALASSASGDGAPLDAASAVLDPTDVEVRQAQDAVQRAVERAAQQRPPSPPSGNVAVVPPTMTDPSWVAEETAPRAQWPRRRVMLAAGAAVAVVAVVGLASLASRPSASAPTPDTGLVAADLVGTGAAIATSPRSGTEAVGAIVAPRDDPDGVLAAGGRHACQVTGAGHVTCWGANERGQLGDGTTERRRAPVSIAGDLAFVQLSAGTAHTCGVTRVGEAYCWGNDARGQLGDATTFRRTVPTRVAGAYAFQVVRAGGAHSCGLTPDALVTCWGANERGQLGDGTTAPQRTVPRPVSSDGVPARWMALTAGLAHSCALDGEGRAYCWGANDRAQLGDGTHDDRRVPTAVSGTMRFRSLAAGAGHTCGVSRDGGVLCWGANEFGQLGTGDRRARVEPTAVPLPAPAVTVATGSLHSCARTDRGLVYCWGRNGFGQLGDGTTSDRLDPKRVQTAALMGAIATTGAHTCARGVTGQVFCWGSNGEGQLGDGGSGDRTLPAVVGIIDTLAADDGARLTGARAGRR